MAGVGGFGYCGQWIPAFAGMMGGVGMTRVVREWRGGVVGMGGFGYCGQWIPAFAGMTGMAREWRG